MPHGCPLNLTPTPHLRNSTNIVKKLLNSKMKLVFKLFRVKKSGHVVTQTSEESPTRQAKNGEKGQKNGLVENGEEGQQNGRFVAPKSVENLPRPEVENAEEGQNNGCVLTPQSVENPPGLEAENDEEGKKNDNALTPKSVENPLRLEAENVEAGQNNGHALTPKSVENPPTPEAVNGEEKKPTRSESEPSNGTTLSTVASTPTENVEGPQVHKNQDPSEAEGSAQSVGNPLNPEELLELTSTIPSLYLGRTDETQPVRRFIVNAFHLEPPSSPPIEDSFEPSGKMTVFDLVALTLADPKFNKQLKEMIVSPPLDPKDLCDDPCSNHG